MHILQLLPRLEVGGVERGVVDLAKGLIARGHQVSVVSAGGPLVEPLTRLGARHYQLPVHEKSLAAMWSCIPPSFNSSRRRMWTLCMPARACPAGSAGSPPDGPSGRS